jgi:hypothetical protein
MRAGRRRRNGMMQLRRVVDAQTRLSSDTSTGFQMTARVKWLAQDVVSWRVMLVAATLSTLLGVTIARAIAGQRSALEAGAPTSASIAARTGSASLPAAAEGPVSSAIGTSAAAYRVSGTAGTLHAASPAQRLQIDFGPAGASLRSASTRLQIGLRGVGYGDALSAVAPVAPRALANRAVYAHPGVTEWYANGPLGLEQGFTLARPPAGAAAAPLTLAIGLSTASGGGAHASLAAGGRGVTVGRRGAGVSYGELHASDARGRALHSWLVLERGRILLRVDARGASYPLRIDPLLHQAAEEKLTPSDSGGGGLAGFSVALSADGNTALIGGPRELGGQAEFAGAAWVFVRDGAGWVQQGPKLIPTESEGEDELCGEPGGSEGAQQCGFARSVALSADGNTALIGAPRENGRLGVAWVYTRSGGTWTQAAKLRGEGESTEARFGRAVALSGDGSTALIGAPSDRNALGSAWVFTRSGSSWAQQGPPLVGGAEGEPHFGGSVALSGDGNTALIGEPGDDGYTGAARAFKRSGSSWSLAGGKLTGGSEEAGTGHFGYSVALSADASTALVGGRTDGEGEAANDGAAWVFAASGGGYVQQGAKLTGGTDPGEEFGYSVALSGNGNLALIGAPHSNSARGAAWLFERSGEAWGGATQRLEAGGEELGKAWFGASAALSADGVTALLGSPVDHNKFGAGWVFGPNPRVTDVNPKHGPPAGGTTVTIEGINFNDVEAVHFGAVAAASVTVNGPDSITATSPPGAGTVHVTVTTPLGTSETSVHDEFAYKTEKGKEKEKEAEVPVVVGGGTGGTKHGSGSGSVLSFGPTSAGGACVAALVSRSIGVTHSRAVVRLVWRGVGSCTGKLRLKVKVKRRAGKKLGTVTRTIAAGGFTIEAGRARTVKLKLNAFGRALLKAGHGRLRASLLVVSVSAGTSQAKTSNVRLAVPRKKPKHTRK